MSGVGAAMQPEDVLFTVYREIGTKFWRGVDMLDMLLYWGGDERGTNYRSSAAGFSVLRADRLADAACGRRRAGDPDPRRARAARWPSSAMAAPRRAPSTRRINLAGAKSLPLVCVIVNNRWAISVPVSAQTAAQTLAQKAIAAGIPAMQVDGNDVLVVREAVQRGARARSRRRRPDRHRGTHLSPQRSHHLGRCHPLSQRRRGRGGAAASNRSRACAAFLSRAGSWDDARRAGPAAGECSEAGRGRREAVSGYAEAVHR